jgi:para-aminobenzoate synthetase
VRILLVDNYDSYTFNLYQLLAEIVGEPPEVVRNDSITPDAPSVAEADAIVISPGPGHPASDRDFGIGSHLILHGEVPTLGVCLGHQGIAHVFGGDVSSAPAVFHGRISQVRHSGDEIFAGIESGFSAVRYHSLAVQPPLPDVLEEIAWAEEEDEVVMGLRHKERPIWGVQFHPESIGTPDGVRLLANFVEIARRAQGQAKQVSEPVAAVDLAVEDPRGRRNGTGSVSSDAVGQYSLSVREVKCLPDPARVFSELFGDDEYAFWLDSSRDDGQQARFSFMGTAHAAGGEVLTYNAGSRKVMRFAPESGLRTATTETIFSALASGLREAHLSDQLPFDFACGYVGYFGYELKADCGAAKVHQAESPDACFLFAPLMAVFDHLTKTSYALCLANPELSVDGAELAAEELAVRLGSIAEAGPLPPQPIAGSNEVEFRMALDRDEYVRGIELSKQALVAGESYEICLTNRIEAEADVDPLQTYLQLRHGSPAPYAAFLRFGDQSVLSSSPERFLRISRDGFVESKPIKGTRKRGATEAEDEELFQDLATSVKDRAENLMIVDLLRNDLGLVSEIGSVTAAAMMEIESYEHVHQLVSTIRGKLRSDCGPVDCVKACFPGGSMTGAPKLRTMEIIDSLEPNARGVYSGALGYFGLSGGADLSIVIRALTLVGNRASIGAGGAITVLSDPDAEFEEMLIKARPLMKVLRTAETTDTVAPGPATTIGQAAP